MPGARRRAPGIGARLAGPAGGARACAVVADAVHARGRALALAARLARPAAEAETLAGLAGAVAIALIGAALGGSERGPPGVARRNRAYGGGSKHEQGQRL